MWVKSQPQDERRLRKASRKRRLGAWAAGAALTALAPSGARAEIVGADLLLVSPGEYNYLTMTVTGSIPLGTRSDTKYPTLSGNVLTALELDFDPLTHEATAVQTLELTGGRAFLSNVAFRLDWGFLVGRIDLTANGLAGDFDTPTPPAPVVDWTFNAADHVVLLNQGTLRASGTAVVGAFLPENPMTFDLAAMPMAATGSGVGTIEIGAPSIVGNLGTYAVAMVLPVWLDETMEFDNGATVRMQAMGTCFAEGFFQRTLGPVMSTWNATGGGRWDLPENWNGDVPGGAGAAARFAGWTGQAARITLDGDRIVGDLTFDGAYVLSPGEDGRLILNNAGIGARVTVLGGSSEIEAMVRAQESATFDIAAGAALSASGGLLGTSGATVRKTGEGTMVVRGGMTLEGTSQLDVQQGPMDVDRLSGSGALRLGSGARLTLGEGARPGSASTVSSLELAGVMDAWEATLDLGIEPLVIYVEPGAETADLTRITNQIKSARRPAGDWLGQGITSSAAAEDASRLTGLAVALEEIDVAMQADFGQPASYAILVRWTWNGDMNLDGRVDADDYFNIDSGFLRQDRLTYQYGDLNYDGRIDADDYFLIDKAFLGQGAPIPFAAAPVPEPGILSLAACAGWMLLARRRRNHAGGTTRTL